MIVFGGKYGIPIAIAAGATRYDPSKDACIARIREDGTVMGGFLFTEYTGLGGSYMTHVAGLEPHWLNRALLFNAGNYAFNHSQCRKIFGLVRSDLPKVLAFDLKLGWKEECCMTGVYPEADCHVLSMTKEDCRWLNWSPKKGVVDGR